MFFSKEINKQRNVKHLLLRKTDVLKTWRISKLLRKKIWRNALALKSKKGTNTFGKLLFWHYYLQLSFVCKFVSQISFNLFCSGDKKLLSEFFAWTKEKSWKHTFNTNNELSQNCKEKQIMPSKTTINWLFNDIRCYLFIACFDWEIDLFQQL